jgi:2-haloacid dehalogenase
MDVQALVFDVFGTLVDWRTGVAREAERILGRGSIDGGAFADAWRALYQPAMEPVRSGQRPWTDLDTLHGESLEQVLLQVGRADLDRAAREDLVRAWHRLDAWPDVREALSRLRERFILAPLSNAHFALSIALARRNGIVWDAVLGAEFARDYKPKPRVYLSAVEAFRLQPGQIVMVACHSSDLAAAAQCGVRTAHVARPDERGPGRGETRADGPVDFSAGDLRDLAGQLGA